jgi:hypothetical protein
MNLIMRNVEFPLEVDWCKYHSYVANVFWNQRIGKVSEVSLIPYVKGNVLMYVCLVRIREWFDSECGYNFMNRLKEGSKEVRLIYSDDNWWTVQRNDMYNEKSVVDCYTVKFEESEFDVDLESESETNLEVNVVSDDEDILDMDDCPPPSLERGGNYWCALCGEGQGGMMSVCDNNNCLWYNKSFLEIAFKDSKNDVSVINEDVPPSIIPDASWFDVDVENKDVAPPRIPSPSWFRDLIDDVKNDEDDVPPTIIPPSSWLNCGINLEDIQDEWVKISTESKMNESDNVVVPEFSVSNKYFCGFCGETNRGLFSLCWNKSCERYNKSIDDIYEDNFNLKDLKNVTLRNHQQNFHHEVSL